MRGPFDEPVVAEESAAIEGAARPRGRKPTDKPPGGKALERLMLFNESHGFVIEAGGETRSGKPRRRGAGAAAIPTASPNASLAQSFVEAGEVLASATTSTLKDLERGSAAPGETAPGEVAALGAPAWEFIGPIVMPGGQTYGDTRVDVSGRVSCIAIDPGNSNHLLCGSAAGGLWESRDRGATWTPRTDFAPTLTVGAVAFDPANPSRAYCGTGEGNFYSGLGAGVLRSLDGGSTWTRIASAPFIGRGFYDLIVDPANGSHLIAASTGGLHELADGGVNWTARRAARTWDLSMHPAGGASSEVLAACQDGLFRSTNGGTTWAAVALPAAPASWDRLAVDHARSNPAVAYAFGTSGGTGRLYRRNAAGAWQAVALPAGLDVSQAWYDWFVGAAIDRDGEVYLGAIEAYRGNLSGTTWTWVTISNKAGDDIHPDQHAIAFDQSNPGTLYIGCDGGLFRSPNRGTNWVALNRGLGIAEIEYVAHDPGSSRWLIGGTQDNGSVRWTGNPVWDHIADGDGGDCGVNTTTPDTVFHSYFRMGFERSSDRGASWTWIPTASRDPNVYGQLFYPPFEARGSTVAQAGQSVYVSRANGASLVQVALPGNPIASAMHMPTSDRIFVGTTDGRLFRITWGGSAWSAASELTRPRTANMSDIHVDPSNANRVWATYTTPSGGRVFRSDDGGATWRDVSAGLPAIPINSVEVDPWNTNRAWIAADLGVYQTLDAGASWSVFGIGLPNALVADLVFHPHARVLRAGTRNRGVWQLPVDGWMSTPICGTQFTGTLAANETKRWFTFNWPATWHIMWSVMPTTPRPGAPQVSFDVNVERASAEFATYWIIVRNLTPVPVTFEGRYAIFSRY